MLVPGRVLRLFCSFTNPPKEKFVVIAATDPCLVGFLINTSPTDFQKKRPHLMAELIKVHANDGYPFLTNPTPSYLDCTVAEDLDENDVLAQVEADPKRDLKMISDTTLAQIVGIVSTSVTLDSGTTRLILKGLKQG